MLEFSHSIEDYPQGIVLAIDKPYRWTSADLVNKVKWAAVKHFGKKNLKVGHAGTLDPLATGILLVCIGPATRRAEELQRSPKEYVAGVTFGATTASYDLEKEVECRLSLDNVSEESVRGILPGFVGDQMQVAPLFSAKSVDGVRAYEMARELYKKGQSLEDTGILQANRIEIYEMELEKFITGDPVTDTTELYPNGSISGGRYTKDTCPNGSISREKGTYLNSSSESNAEAMNGHSSKQSLRPNPRIHVSDINGLGLPTAMIRVGCSKGTYIRALARDLGEALGSGAFLSSLRRTKNGGYTISEAVSLEEVLKAFGQ